MTAAPLRAALRHFFAWAATTGTWLVVWTAIYLFLLLWALIAGEGIGSPVLYPLGLLAIFILHSIATLLVFLPATLLAELLCHKKQLPKLSGGIPLAFAFFLIEIALCGYLLSISSSPEAPTTPEAILGLLLTLAIPMGFYWWASQFPSLLRVAFLKIRQRFSKNASS
jgi:hypothetical protein